jgi:hypothetical protein
MRHGYPRTQVVTRDGVVDIAQVAQVVSAALSGGAAALAHGQPPLSVIAAVAALRGNLARKLGRDPAAEDLEARLRELPEIDLREILALAQAVLAETDPGGTAAGRYAIPGSGDGVEVRVVRIRRTGQKHIDMMGHLARVGEPAPPADHPADQPATVDPRVELALSHSSAAHTSTVIWVAEQMLADRERRLGMDHPETLNLRADLAHLYHAAGRREEAIDAMERVVVDRRRIQGNDDPATVTAQTTLDQWRHEA